MPKNNLIDLLQEISKKNNPDGAKEFETALTALVNQSDPYYQTSAFFEILEQEFLDKTLKFAVFIL